MFDGPKTQCMKDYIKPTLKLSQKQIILHCGTNNLPLSEDPETIAKIIMNLDKNIKTDTAKVVILGISHEEIINLKAKQVNNILKKICKEVSIPFISHYGIKALCYLQSEKICVAVLQN